MLHITNGDAVVPEIARAVGLTPESILVWRDVLHDGPVPEGLDPDPLAQVRAKHLASRGWVDEAVALADLRNRDSRLASAPEDEEIVLWFEEDLFDLLQLAQITDRLSGRSGPVSRVYLPHHPRGDLQFGFQKRVPLTPDGAIFAAFRSPSPLAWVPHPELHRLLEELPDSHTGLSRLEQLILETLNESQQLDPQSLYREVARREHTVNPPWIADLPLLAIVEDLRPLITDCYQITPLGRAVLLGNEVRRRPQRWIGGVDLGNSNWVLNTQQRAVVSPANTAISFPAARDPQTGEYFE